MRFKIVLFFIGAGLIIFLFLFFNLSAPKKSSGATESLTTGAFIINMGVTPQTYANGLKPYGMLFDLIVNYSVPVKWVIEPTKVKDGIDFTYGATNFKGGTFIIPAEYINSTVSSRISYWQTQGVQGAYTTSSISVPVYAGLTSFPVAMIDDQAGKENIIMQYYTNAGISSAGYVVGTPSSLQACNDLWVNPHGDPTWASHGYLYNYATTLKCFIWAECHAVSVMEGIQNSASPFQRLNYLTTNGLKCYSNNQCGTGIIENHSGNSSSPYTYYYPSDPMMQFMGTMDGASDAGSEKWYQPQAASSGAWRATTKRLVTTGTGTLPNEGVLMVYGPAYGNVSNGYVMYEAGHDLDGTGSTTEKVAAQRAYFNYVLFAGLNKQLTFSGYSIPGSYKSVETKTVSATVSTGTAPFAYSWTSTIGGSFAGGSAATAAFTAPNTPVVLTGAVKCTVTDACGRKNFVSQIVSVSENTLPIDLKSLTAREYRDDVIVEWTTASELNNDYFTLSRSMNGFDYIELERIKGSGTSTRDINYSFTDQDPIVGKNYYRLSQTDIDGNMKMFPPVRVLINAQQVNNAIVSASFITNNNLLKIDFSANEKSSADFIVLSSNGSIVRTKKVYVTEGYSTVVFEDLSDLPQGIYFVIMNLPSGESSSKKFIKM